MKKTQLAIPLLLPQIPDAHDRCVARLSQMLSGRAGIEEAHLSRKNGSELLCIHYDPELISLERVEALARYSGAQLEHTYGHFLQQMDGVRHPRHARLLSEKLLELPGVVEGVVGASGTTRIEYETARTSPHELLYFLEQEGITLAPESDDQHPPSSHTKPKHENGSQHPHRPAQGNGLLGKHRELVFAVLSGIALATGFGLSYLVDRPYWLPLALYLLAYFFGGYFTAREALEKIARREFEIDFLMLIAAAGAAALGEWAEGALLLFLFSLGHSLEHYAMGKARDNIVALSQLAPSTALVKVGESERELPVSSLQLGQVILVKPHTSIPVDGRVIRGSSSVNQAPITGESIPVAKQAAPASQENRPFDQLPAEQRVFAGTLNGSGLLEVEVGRLAKDSTVSRLVALVREAETQKSPTQRFTDRFERIFVPAVLALVVLLLFAGLVIDEPFSASFYRAMAVLVAASPCALAIATPSAVLSAVGRAAKLGVLIKGGRPLEDLGRLKALAFDKTGTLTRGKPRLNALVAAPGISELELLQAAAAVEKLSDHPLAEAVVEGAREKMGSLETLPDAHTLQAIPGRGIRAQWQDDTIYLGNLALFQELPDTLPLPAELEQAALNLLEQGNSIMVVRHGHRYLGVLGVLDTPRPEAAEVLRQLKALGIERMVMLSGDNQRVADAVARSLGLTDARGDLLPEDKRSTIEQLKQDYGSVAMVGDGVNDAPAMARSTVGIAMGAASSAVALETADVALMDNSLKLLPFTLGLSRQSRSIIKQNVYLSLGMVALLIPLTVLGIADIGPAVVAHEGSTLLVVGNALRLLRYPV